MEKSEGYIMKHVVVVNNIKQADIKPYKLFNDFLAVTEKEVKRILIDNQHLVDVVCPACQSEKRGFAFEKFGLTYHECRHCGTLYVSPRPPEKVINTFFKESRSMDFWNDTIVKKTIHARVTHLVRPEVLWVANTTEKFFTKPATFVDIKTRHAEFLEEIRSLNLFDRYVVIDPDRTVHQTINQNTDFNVLPDSFWEIPPNTVKAQAITSFYVLDRLFQPEQFLKKIQPMLADKGLLFLVSSSSSGLDLRELWDRAKTIFPPENMNIFSVEGIKTLLENNGFELLELSTPGQLDVEYIKTAMKNESDLPISRFIAYMIKNRDEATFRAFQNFLQEYQLSSHLRIVARKKKNE